MPMIRTLGLLVILIGLALPAQAGPVTLNIDPAGTVETDGHQLQFSDGSGFATVDNYFDDSTDFFDSQFLTSSVFCFDRRFGVCDASGALTFSTAIFDLKLTMEQTSTFNPNANAAIYNNGAFITRLFWRDIIYDPLNPLTPGPTRLFDFSGFGPITELRLTPGDTVFYGDFAFNTAAVPAPPAIALLLLGLLGLCRARHCRARQSS